MPEYINFFKVVDSMSVLAYCHIIYFFLPVEQGKTSKFITAGCSENAAAFKINVYHFLYKLAAAGC